jgi:hypothetical protein
MQCNYVGSRCHDDRNRITIGLRPKALMKALPDNGNNNGEWYCVNMGRREIPTNQPTNQHTSMYQRIDIIHTIVCRPRMTWLTGLSGDAARTQTVAMPLRMIACLEAL